MTPAGEARLRVHAATVAAAGHAPAGIAADLADEMLGHLVEAVEGRMATGMDEETAVAAAILAFGGRATVGAELARTYHNALWGSTVGVLLAPRDDDRVQPWPIGALRLLVAIGFLVTLLAGLAPVVALTPVGAVVTVTAIVVSSIVSVLTFRGLALGRGWALLAAVGLACLVVFSGLRQVADAPAGTTIIPLLAIYAGFCLLWIARAADRVSAFVAGSRPIGRALGALVGLAIVGPSVVLAALPSIHDPTQAVAADAAMTVSMTCGIGAGEATGDPTLDNQPTAILSVSLAWARTDLLPEGLDGLLNGGDINDTAGFRVIDPAPVPIDGGGALPRWLAALRAPGVDAVTGEEIGWFGSTSPSVERIPKTIGSFTVGIDNNRIKAGHTIRIDWILTPTQDGPQTWPRAEVAYAHLDRFVLIGTVGCGETARATDDTVPAPRQSGLLDP